GRKVWLNALRDTGNTLTDPLTGRAVMVAQADRLHELFPPGACPEATQLMDPARSMAQLEQGVLRGRLRLLPYRAVGVSCGMLLAVRVDSAVLEGEEKGSVLVALSPTPVSDGGPYCALVGSAF
ncbi:MAG: sigma-E processing peptidase SpoIIGA, partial [Oscillospiraceae bacterium]|nr:sigma-E processing peptidase SpoIIGA [Oscillospiraceae bacterium]